MLMLKFFKLLIIDPHSFKNRHWRKTQCNVNLNKIVWLFLIDINRLDIEWKGYPIKVPKYNTNLLDSWPQSDWESILIYKASGWAQGQIDMLVLNVASHPLCDLRVFRGPLTLKTSKNIFKEKLGKSRKFMKNLQSQRKVKGKLTSRILFQYFVKG